MNMKTYSEHLDADLCFYPLMTNAEKTDDEKDTVYTEDIILSINYYRFINISRFSCVLSLFMLRILEATCFVKERYLFSFEG